MKTEELTWKDITLLNELRAKVIRELTLGSPDGIVFSDPDDISKIVLDKFKEIKKEN